MSWWNPYSEPRRELRTSLPPAECCARLRRRVIQWWAIFPNEDRPLKGRVTETKFALYRWHFGHHGFETEARGRFQADASGTRVPISFGFSLKDRIFLVLGPLIVIGVGGVFWFGQAGRPDPGSAVPRWLPFIWFAVVVGLYFFLRRAMLGDTKFLVRLICENLDAHEPQAQRPIE